MPSSDLQEKERALKKQLDGMSRQHIDRPAITYELLSVQLAQLKKAPWYKSPELWVGLVAAVSGCLAAYAAFFPPSVPAPQADSRVTTSPKQSAQASPPSQGSK